MLRQPRQNDLAQVAVGFAPRENHAFEDRDARITEDQLFTHAARGAEPTAHLARAERRIEREVSGLELGHADAAGGTAVALREHLGNRLGALVAHHLGQPLGKAQRGFDRIGDPPAIVGADDEAIDHDRDGVIEAPVELRWIGELDQLAVNDRAHEALLAGSLEELAELALALLHQRRTDLEARALGPGEHLLSDLRGALALHRAAAAGAVRRAGARIEQAQVIVDFGDGTDGRPGIVAGRLLLDRNGR